MAERSWYVASGGRRTGPFSESQLNQMLVSGQLPADGLVWCEGMKEWQTPDSVPGLARVAPPPATMPGAYLSARFTVWGLLWRGFVLTLATVLIVPAPWAATMFYRWVIAQIDVPQRPALAFTGRPGDIWYVFVGVGICIYINEYAQVQHLWYVTFLIDVLQAYLSFLTARWVIENISSAGEHVPLTFTGEALTYIGWYVLMALSFVTIIGWAWVATAWMRWMCRNISGSRRAISFHATGWQMLWRVLVFVLSCILVIPIPWTLRWYARWFVSQFAVGPQSA
jgi:GYF domain 2